MSDCQNKPASVFRCSSCGKKCGELGAEDKNYPIGFISIKCIRCNNQDHFLFWENRVYIVNERLLNKKSLLNRLPTEIRNTILGTVIK